MKIKQWKIVLVFCCAASLVTGCGKSGDQIRESGKKEGIAGVVQELYEADYEYQKTETRYMHLLDENGETTGEQGLVTTVYEGKNCANPLENHMRVVQESQESAWTERYVIEEGNTIRMSTKTQDGEIFSQELGKGFDYAWRYPYGYGKDLKFEKIREETADGILCDVYQTQYRESVPVDEKDSLEATIYQEYFIKKDNQRVWMICTDLQDFYDKKGAASRYSQKDISLEEAVKQMEGCAKGASDQLKILNYNGNIEIEPL